MQTEPFTLSPLDLDSLPGLGDICQGELPLILTREIEQTITDACDPRKLPQGPRTVSLVLGCRPDAEGGSAVWGVERLQVTLAGSRRPRTGRVVFDRPRGTLRARTTAPAEPEPEPMDDSSPIVLGLSIEQLIAGELDLAFKRASVHVYLDVDDRRKKRAALRTVAFKIATTADEDRLSVRLELTSVKVRRAPAATKNAQRLYINRRGTKLIAQLEPDAYLPGGDVGQQAAVSGTVVDFPTHEGEPT